MNLHNIQTLFQVLIAFGIICTAFGGLGNFLVGKRIQQEDSKGAIEAVEKGKTEVLNGQQKTTEKIGDAKNEILEEIRKTYRRVQGEHEIQTVNIDEAAKRTFELARNKNANLILKKGYEKEGGFGTWFGQAPIFWYSK